jgi:hypothetical protein
LRQKQSYFSKTFDSWQVQDSKIKTHKKVSKRGSKQQASLFDE